MICACVVVGESNVDVTGRAVHSCRGEKLCDKRPRNFDPSLTSQAERWKSSIREPHFSLHVIQCDEARRLLFALLEPISCSAARPASLDFPYDPQNRRNNFKDIFNFIFQTGV